MVKQLSDQQGSGLNSVCNKASVTSGFRIYAHVVSLEEFCNSDNIQWNFDFSDLPVTRTKTRFLCICFIQSNNASLPLISRTGNFAFNYLGGSRNWYSAVELIKKRIWQQKMSDPNYPSEDFMCFISSNPVASLSYDVKIQVNHARRNKRCI